MRGGLRGRAMMSGNSAGMDVGIDPMTQILIVCKLKSRPPAVIRSQRTDGRVRKETSFACNHEWPPLLSLAHPPPFRSHAVHKGCGQTLSGRTAGPDSPRPGVAPL